MRSKQRMGIAVGLVSFCLMLPSVSAQTLGNLFINGLTLTGTFLTDLPNRPYAVTIDFIFFFGLFVSIYLIGVKYAFREVTRPVKVIAVLLGLMTALLFIQQGYSLVDLLPYAHWLLFLLLVLVVYKLLEYLGMQSKFWRFLLAIIVVFLVWWLLNNLPLSWGQGTTSPSTGGEKKGFFSTLGKLDLSPPSIEAPQLPDVSGLGGGTTTNDNGVVLTDTPKEATGGSTASGRSPWIWIILVTGLLAAGGIGGAIAYKKNKGGNQRPDEAGEAEEEPPAQESEEEESVEEIIQHIKRFMEKASELGDDLLKLFKKKNKELLSYDHAIALLNGITEDDIAYLASGEGKAELKIGGDELRKLLKNEKDIIDVLRQIYKVQYEFYGMLDNWEIIIETGHGISFGEKFNELRMITNAGSGDPSPNFERFVRQNGILHLVRAYFNYARKDFADEEELRSILDLKKIEELLHGKYEAAKGETALLKKHSSMENQIMARLIVLVKKQEEMLQTLKKELKEIEGGQEHAAHEGGAHAETVAESHPDGVGGEHSGVVQGTSSGKVEILVDSIQGMPPYAFDRIVDKKNGIRVSATVMGKEGRYKLGLYCINEETHETKGSEAMVQSGETHGIGISGDKLKGNAKYVVELKAFDEKDHQKASKTFRVVVQSSESEV